MSNRISSFKRFRLFYTKNVINVGEEKDFDREERKKRIKNYLHNKQ